MAFWGAPLKDVNKTNTAFELYQFKKFEQSEKIYQSWLEDNPKDFISKLFIDRCHKYTKSKLSENWDGCFTFVKNSGGQNEKISNDTGDTHLLFQY